jgi:hypothetical protein
VKLNDLERENETAMLNVVSLVMEMENDEESDVVNEND